MKILRLIASEYTKTNLTAEQIGYIKQGITPDLDQPLVGKIGDTLYIFDATDDLAKELAKLAKLLDDFTFFSMNDKEIDRVTRPLEISAAAIPDEKASHAIATASNATAEEELEISACSKCCHYLYQLGLGISIIIETGLTSASLPIFIAILMQNIQHDDDLPQETKLILTSTLWAVCAAIHVAIPIYNIGSRANHPLDLSVKVNTNQHDDPKAVALVCTNSVFTLLGGFLQGFSVNPFPQTTIDKIKSYGLGVTVGTLEWLVYMLADAQTWFEEYARDKNLKHLPQQSGVISFYRKADIFAKFLREIYAPVMAGLTAAYVFDFPLTLAQEFKANDDTKLSIQVISGFLSIFIYLVTAKVYNDFDIKKMFAGLNLGRTENLQLSATPKLSRSKYRAVKFFSDALHGKVIDRLADRFNISANTLANIVTSIYAVGGINMTARELYYFISSANSKVGLAKFCFFNNPEDVTTTAKTAVPIELGLATFSFFSARSKNSAVEKSTARWLKEKAALPDSRTRLLPSRRGVDSTRNYAHTAPAFIPQRGESADRTRSATELSIQCKH